MGLKKSQSEGADVLKNSELLLNDPLVVYKNHNPFLLSAIQPQGNLKISDERYMQTGNSVVTCVQVTSTPAALGRRWMSLMSGMLGEYGISNAIFTLDIAEADIKSVKKKVDDAIAELSSRKNETTSDMMQSQYHMQLLGNLLQRLTEESEVIKYLVPRIYIYGATKGAVDDDVNKLLQNLSSHNFTASVMLNETQYQYRALFRPYSDQQKELNHRPGIAVTTKALAIGFPFSREYLDDPFGVYLGYTDTGGNVFFDIFRKTAERKSYDALVVGKKGAGKSTLLKLLAKYHTVMGNYVRILDVDGEFTELAKKYGGTVISCDGTDGLINYCEIFPGSDSEQTNRSQHLSKMNSLYRFIAPSAPNEEANQFEALCRQLYERFGIFDPGNPDCQVTGYTPESYPTLADLVELTREQLYVEVNGRRLSNPDLSESARQRLENIELNVGNLVRNYPQLFATTTTLASVAEQHLIVYNVKSLMQMKEEIFKSQMFNILSLMLKDMIFIGGQSKKMYEDNGVPSAYLPKVVLIIDEAHKFINTKNSQVLSFITDILRNARKYFTSLIFASQNIRDFAPEARDGTGIDDLKKLMELVQYTFLMQQDSNARTLLERLYGGVLTDGQLDNVPRLKVGETYLMDGIKPLHMHVQITAEEEALFHGGA